MKKTTGSFFLLITLAEIVLKMFFLESGFMREKILNIIILTVLTLVFSLSLWLGINFLMVYGLLFLLHSFAWSLVIMILINLLFGGICLILLRGNLEQLNLKYFAKSFFRRIFGNLLGRS